MSLRVRLLLASVAVALVALVVADVTTYSALRRFLVQRIDQSLEAVHADIERALTGGEPVSANAIATIAPDVFVQVRDSSGNVLVEGSPSRSDEDDVTPVLPDQLDPGATTAGPGEPHTFFTVAGEGDGAPSFRVRGAELANGETLYLALPLEEVHETLGRLLRIEILVTLVAVATAAALGWWLVRLGLRPLRAVEQTAEAIAAGQLEERVPGDDRPTEVGHLAAALNTMLGRIEAAFAERDATEAELRRSEERLRRFVADASHELRTPLAAVSAYTELFERGAGSHPEDVPRAMAGIRHETARMGHLVDDLLLLARLDEGLPLERQPVDVVAVVGEAREAAAAVGPAWPVRLAAARPFEVLGDRVRLRQVMDNLLANVRAHTPPGTPTSVTVRAAGGQVVIEVADHGPGLDADEAARVFERFYRVDASRARARGGAGLGLPIVASIVKAHGGTVSVSTTDGGGATFTVRLPARPDDPPP